MMTTAVVMTTTTVVMTTTTVIVMTMMPMNDYDSYDDHGDGELVPGQDYGAPTVDLY
jgi:hypothetical protein